MEIRETRTSEGAQAARTGLGGGAVARHGSGVGTGETAAGAVVRRRGAVVAAEGLGELRGLAVADAMGDVPHGQAADAQQLGGALHPDGGQVLTEGRLTDLRVGALKLTARRGDAPRDVVQ